MYRTCCVLSVDFAPRFTMAIAAIVLSVVGCSRSGPPISGVSGTVTLEGKPFYDHSVINLVHSESGFGVTGKLAEDGTYSLRSQHGGGIPLGNYKVTILPPPPAPMGDPTAGPPAGQSRIPRKYQAFATSDFEVEVVQGGPNVFDFDMKP